MEMVGELMSDSTIPASGLGRVASTKTATSSTGHTAGAVAPNATTKSFSSLLQSIVASPDLPSLTPTPVGPTTPVESAATRLNRLLPPPNSVSLDSPPTVLNTEDSSLAQLMELFIRALLAQYPSSAGTLSAAATSTANQFVDGALNSSSSPAAGQATVLSTAQLERVTAQATQMAGVPESWITPLTKIALNESSGQTNAVNQQLTGDSEHARGLMQTEPTTFKAYAAVGHTDINNPLDNMLAAIGYIRSRYGDANAALQKSLHGGY